MHVHAGILQLLIMFLGGVILPGTFWRLVTVHLANGGSLAQTVSQAMAFMY